MRASFARMIFKVSKAIVKKSPPLDDLKTLVSLYKRNLNDKLDDCDSVSGVVSLIQKECDIADIELLQTVVEEFNVTEADRYIDQYKTALENGKNLMPFMNVSRASPKKEARFDWYTSVYYFCVYSCRFCKHWNYYTFTFITQHCSNW